MEDAIYFDGDEISRIKFLSDRSFMLHGLVFEYPDGAAMTWELFRCRWNSRTDSLGKMSFYPVFTKGVEVRVASPSEKCGGMGFAEQIDTVMDWTMGITDVDFKTQVYARSLIKAFFDSLKATMEDLLVRHAMGWDEDIEDVFLTFHSLMKWEHSRNFMTSKEQHRICERYVNMVLCYIEDF